MKRALPEKGKSRPAPAGRKPKDSSRPSRGPFDGALRPRDTPLEAACRLLHFLQGVIADSRTAALKGTSPEAVHDLRVGIRRFRAVLRLFRKPLCGTSAPLLDGALSALTDRLGPIRDHEVWFAFLRDQAAPAGLAHDTEFRTLLRAAERKEAALRGRLRRMLASRSCERLMAQLAMPVQCPSCAGKTGSARSTPPGIHGARTLEAHLALRLRRSARRLAAQPVLTPNAAAEDVHALRKRVRRARYNAEFATPVLGRPAQKLALRLKLLADALGDIHDLDVHLHRLTWRVSHPPGVLAALLLEKRARAWRRYRREWQRLANKKFRIRRLRGIH